ncbi:MAG: aminomethyltransferase family protein [Hyphomicrobium sp.]|uniref:aminomethyltransferase family protein n=1 Tax=Hyphomicrobium sp. TaxID=82 RepID=UPI0039E5CDCE
MSLNTTRLVVAADEDGGWDYGTDRGPYSSFHLANGAKYCVYNNRLMPVTQKIDRIDGYWALRQKVALFDTGERPIEIKGPEAEKLANKVFTRNISNLKPGRAAYSLLCYPNGTLLCDGVLLRFAADHFWFVQADGPVFSWLIAQSEGLDVKISDPRSWVAQVQGPASLDILNELVDGGIPDDFKYFAVRRARIKGQNVVITRTGWTNELGFEFYTLPDEPGYDGEALWGAVLEAGRLHGLQVSGLDSMEIRRIEAGILNNGSDFDNSFTPFDAGLGAYVDFSKDHFIGRSALETASREPRLIGLISKSGEPLRQSHVTANGKVLGFVTAAAYSPYLDAGIAIVRLNEPIDEDRRVTVTGRDLKPHAAVLSNLPLYDKEKKIPRGLAVDIPERPPVALRTPVSLPILE